MRKRHAEAAKALSDAGVVDKAALGRAVVAQTEAVGWLPGLSQQVAAVRRPQLGELAAGNDE